MFVILYIKGFGRIQLILFAWSMYVRYIDIMRDEYLCLHSLGFLICISHYQILFLSPIYLSFTGAHLKMFT